MGQKTGRVQVRGEQARIRDSGQDRTELLLTLKSHSQMKCKKQMKIEDSIEGKEEEVEK